jgi:hypothetical protein
MTEYASSDPFLTVQALERDFAANPGDQGTRYRLALALETLTVAARSVTRDQTLVITSERQRELCQQVAGRILQLQVGEPRLTAAAQALLAEIETGRRWVWHQQGQAVALMVVVLVLGLGGAVAGGLTRSIPVVAAAAVVSSLLLAVVVIRYRRERWRIRAEEVRPLIWRPGI